jgi:hypothetical protein
MMSIWRHPADWGTDDLKNVLLWGAAVAVALGLVIGGLPSASQAAFGGSAILAFIAMSQISLRELNKKVSFNGWPTERGKLETTLLGLICQFLSLGLLIVHWVIEYFWRH